MPILSQSSSNWMLSIKVVFLSTGVLSMAVILKLSVPVITEFAVSEVPSIWSFVVSWLRPPYLYLIINLIIITILASSKLQHKVDYSPPVPINVIGDVRTDFPVAYNHTYTSPEVSPEFGYGYDANADGKSAASGLDVYGQLDSEMKTSTTTTTNALDNNTYTSPEVSPEFGYGYDANADVKSSAASGLDVYGQLDSKMKTTTTTTTNALDKEMNESHDKLVVSMSSNTTSNKRSAEYSFSTEKPLVSARFGHRKTIKASPPEGGRTLGVASKPKRNDTLEATWKTITDGRPMPLTRHLRKSDTWETPPSQALHVTTPHHHMTKSETFTANNNSPLSRSSGSGKLRKEPSPSQDELNRRVEAFINKFNEDMRLQRQESLNQFMEMINRGAH
ncbi:uncharacterized protein LOC132307734 [Cornus florida]|uniref:uncharacterized protein LOC132307734 n=1 Tax=Cornus florida TaxID=4283 RepID=UPI00289F54E7|nr:uncharacterized protein LOC132307734 [Cornus florida]